jgi:hypothetical protein
VGGHRLGRWAFLPLSPTNNCEPRRPLPRERWDWVVCRNAAWINKLWSAIYPGPDMGAQTAVSLVASCPRTRRSNTAYRFPRRELLQCVPRVGPPKGTLTSSEHKPSENQNSASFVNLGELSAPLILMA